MGCFPSTVPDFATGTTDPENLIDHHGDSVKTRPSGMFNRLIYYKWQCSIAINIKHVGSTQQAHRVVMV